MRSRVRCTGQGLRVSTSVVQHILYVYERMTWNYCCKNIVHT